MAIVNYRTKKKLTARERKAAVLSATGWDEKTYQRRYRVFFNRAKNYEQLTGKPLTQKVVDLFASYATGEAKFGDDYRPTQVIESILSTSAETTTAGQRRGERAAVRAARKELARELTPEEETAVKRTAKALPPKTPPERDPRRVQLLLVLKNFSALIASSTQARRLVESYGVKVGEVVKGTRTRTRKYNGTFENETYDYIKDFDVTKANLEKWSEIRDELEGIVAAGASGFARRYD